MALPRKGTRKISVDGVVYRWHMRKQTLEQSFYKERLTLAVEQANTPSRTTLVIDILASHIDHLEGSIGIGIVTPGLVASAIRQALQNGWQPDQTGRSFLIRMNGEPDSVNKCQPSED